MSVPDWTKTEDWEALYFGDTRMPGVPRVEVELPSGLDLKKGRGRHKARITDEGAPAARIRIEIELLPEELDAFEAVVPMLRPRAAKEPRPRIQIAHPATAMWNIWAVVIGKVSTPHPRAGGSLVVHIEAHEWVEEPKKIGKKPKVTASSEFSGTEDMDALISDLTPASEEQVLQSFDPSAGLVSQ